MRYISLFSGVEAATLAWRPLGWEPVALSEIDPFACAVLEHRLPGVENLGDVRGIDWRKEMGAHGRVDVVVGGSPCQSFSVAGRREGLDGESGLMWEYVRCVREVRPRWIVWENVPGALSSTHGEDFGCLLRELDALGYGLAWRVLDAQFFGVAQRRRRLFLVGRLGDVMGPCEVLFEPESLSRGAESSRKKRQALAARAGRGPARAGEPVACMADDNSKCAVDDDICGSLKVGGSAPVVAFAANQRGEVRLENGDGSICGAVPASRSGKQVQGVVCQYGDVAGALTARGDSSPCADRGPSVVADGPYVRRLTPRECERLQGMPDDWTRVPYRGKPAEKCPDTPRYRAIGNSMAVPVMRWIGERMQEVENEED